jgi:cell division protein FtsL
VSWDALQNVALWAIAVLKICIWLMALVVVWLTLWARQLGKVAS